MTLTWNYNNYRRYLDRVKRGTQRPWAVEIYSTGWVGREGDSLQKVLEEQATWGRDPFFLSRHMQAVAARSVLNRLLIPMMQGRTVSINSALNEVGQICLKAMTANYRNGRNKSGRFTPVSAKRKAIKERAGLDPRPMMADRRLYDSLRYRIKVG